MSSPILAGSKTLSYTESGAAINITTKILSASDADSPASALKFKVTPGSDANGFFYLSTAPTVKVSEFTLNDVSAGKVFFKPGTSSTAPVINVTANDGASDSFSSALTIKMKAVNDLASFTVSPLSISEGASIDMKGKLSATDEDSTASQLVYSVSGTLAGSFIKTTTVNGKSVEKVVTKFTQADVDGVNGISIAFKHDGSSNKPVINFTLTDAGGAKLTKPAVVTLSEGDDPAVIGGSKTLSYSEDGAAIKITTKILNATDEVETGKAPTASDALKFTVAAGSNIGTEAVGFFYMVNKAGKVTEFTLKDITDGKVFFQPGTTNTQPIIKITVNDGNSTSTSTDLIVKFKAVNDAPTITFAASTLDITEGGTVNLKDKLSSSDEETKDKTQLTYSVSGKLAGAFHKITGEGTAKLDKVVTKFTQADVDSGAISFMHDGSDKSPAIKFTLTDAGKAKSEKAAVIDFTHLASSGESDIGTDANDKFSFASGFKLIDGGKGTDTLIVKTDLNLGGASGVTLKNLESIKLDGSVKLTLSLADVLALSSTSDQVKIDGDATAKVDLGTAAWTKGAEANGYITYTNTTATLVIDSDVVVVKDISVV